MRLTISHPSPPPPLPNRRRRPIYTIYSTLRAEANRKYMEQTGGGGGERIARELGSKVEEGGGGNMSMMQKGKKS